MKNLILIIFLLAATITNINAQRLIPIGDHFLHGDKYINTIQAKAILQINPDALQSFNKSQKQFVSAKALGVTSIIALSSGMLITLVSAPVALISEKAASTAGFGLLLMAGGCVTGTIGLVKKKNAKRNLEKSLLLYNQQNSENEKPDFNLGLSFNGNGAGLTYSF